MSEKFDDELDFDDDFGDFDMDPFSEPPMPKGRSPITHSLLKTGKKFTESFTDDKIDTARKFADASIPSEISGETYDIKRILSGAQEGYRTAIDEVRKEAKPFFNAMDNVIPKGGKLETIVNFAREKMGLNDTSANYEQIAEDSANKAAAAVGELLGQQRTKEEYHNLVRDNIRTKRELSGLEIAATTASNLEFINRFNQEVVSKYQRKSLELQYRHLYTADEQLAVTKTAFEGFKNQLESIVINSALPELTKMHNSEFIKAKLYDKLTDGLFSKEGTVGALRNKFMQEIKGIGTAVAGGMEAATSGLEQYDNVKELSKMAGGTEGIVASILADGLINVIGRKTGDIIGKTKPGKKMVDYIRNVMLDPSEQFRKDAEGKEEGFMKSFFNMASNFTKVGDGERTYSLSNGDGRDTAVFDNNTQTSITKIIPGLLTKILASVDSIRTGTTAEELRYDRDTGTFETITETRNKIKSSIEKDLDTSGVKRNLKYALDDIEKFMPIKFTKEEKADFKEGILNYVYSGKSLHPDTLEENGFYRGFSKKTGLKLKVAIGKFIRADKTGKNKRYLKDYLERLKTSAPDPMATLRKYNDSGSMDLLKETGLVKYNEDSKSYTLNNEEYKKTLGKAVRIDDVTEEETKGRKFNSFIVENLYKMSKEKYEERQKRKEQEDKDNPEGKKKSNWNKFWSTIGEKSINGIDGIYDHGIDGIRDDISNTITKTKDIYNNVNSMEDLKKVLNDLELVKSGRNRYNYLKEVKDVLAKTIRESDNPKEFFEDFKKTDSYKKLASTLKEELETLYGKADVVKDAIVEDITNTNAYKTSKETVNSLKGFADKTYLIFRPTVSEFLNKAAGKIYNILDDDKLSEDNKVRIIDTTLKNVRLVYNKLDNILVEPELEAKKRKEIEKLSKDMKSLYSKLEKFKVSGKSKLSPLIKLSIAFTVESSKYIGDDKVKAILRKTETTIKENLTNIGNTLNNAFSRSNENNVGNKVEGFIATAKEKVENVKESIGIQPKLYGPIEAPKANETKVNPIITNNGLASGIFKKRKSPEEIFNEISGMYSGNKPLLPDNTIVNDNSTKFNEKLLKKINFNTDYYPKQLTEDFKDLLRTLKVNDGTLSKLAAFKIVAIANGLPPSLGMYYVGKCPDPKFNGSLVINADVINKDYPNIKYEINSLIAHEYKHHMQTVSGKLSIGDNPDHYANTITWKNKLFKAAEYVFPFGKYLSSGWEKEAYTEGYNAVYDQLVSEDKIDGSKTNKTSWVAKMYGKAFKLLKGVTKQSVPFIKKDFESKGLEWLYDSNGNLIDKTTKNSINNNITSIASAASNTNLNAGNINVKQNPAMVDSGNIGGAEFTTILRKKPKNKKVATKSTARVYKNKIINKDIGISNLESKIDNNEPISIVKEKPKTIFDNVKEKTTGIFSNVKKMFNADREEILDKVSEKALDKLYKDIDEATTVDMKKLVVKEFINRMYKLLNIVDKLSSNSEKNANLKSKVSTLRAKLKELENTDMEDITKVSEKVETIKEEIHILADKVVPEEDVLVKKAEEFNKKTVKDDNMTFLEILNSDDPVGELKAKVNKKIKSILKSGLVGTYNFGKKFVKADLERGKKLRGYLKEKIGEKYRNWKQGEHGLLRRGLNKGFNLTGTLLSKMGGAASSDMDNGKSMRSFFMDMFKKKHKESKVSEIDDTANIVKKPKRAKVKSKFKDEKVSETSIIKKPKEEKNIHDRDGDGQTDGSWMSILKKRTSGLTNKDNFTAKNIAEKAKTPMGISGIIAMGMIALSAMGVSMKDVAAFTKGAWDVLKGVGTVLGGIWDTLKTVGGWIKDSFGWIKKKLSFGSDDTEELKNEVNKDKETLAKLEASGKTDSKEYRDLKSKIDKNEKTITEEANGSSSASTLGTMAGLGVAGYVGKKVYNVGKAGYNLVKGGVNAVKGVSSAVGLTKNVASKVDAKDLTKKAVSNGKVMEILKTFKGYITKKFKGVAGKKILTNLTKKIAARLVPIAGLAVMAYDVGKITYDVMVNGTELKSAISKQVLGFDLFSDSDVPKDEDGNEIKPDDNLDITNTTSIVKPKDDKLDKRVEQVDKNIQTANGVGSNNIIKPNENFTIDKKVEESKPTTSIGGKISSFFSGLKDKAVSIKDNVMNKVSVGWEKVKGFVSKGIGSVAAYFESGKAGAGTISSGRGDRGGVSYGTHQLASKTGTLQEYIKNSKYRDEFAGLTPATPAFDAKWRDIYARDPEGFAQDQEAFIAKSHYLPQVNNLSGIGLDLNKRSDALKSAAFSVGVQFGPGSKLINKAIDAKGLDPRAATDEEIIKGIYGFKKDYNDSLFKSSSSNVRAGTLSRAFKEEAMVLDLLSKEGYKDPVASVQDKVGTEASNNVTYTPEAPTATVDTNTVKTDTNVSSTVASTTPTTTTDNISTPVASNIAANISTDIKPTNTQPTTVSTVDNSAVAAISETNKGLSTISTTLSASLEVQKQMLEAIKNLNSSLGDRTLNLTKEEKIETPTTTETKIDNGLVQSVGSPNISLARKKYA